MNSATLLLRQIHPAWVQRGRFTSQAFRPTRKDEYSLSVYDGDLVTAEGSWEHYTVQQGFDSAGVAGVTVEECEDLDLAAESDPAPFPAHAVVRFDGHSNSQIATKAKHLKRAAAQRGWQYRADAEQQRTGKLSPLRGA